jgi:hypothetical protein
MALLFQAGPAAHTHPSAQCAWADGWICAADPAADILADSYSVLSLRGRDKTVSRATKTLPRPPHPRAFCG